jgi:hypothetical protein
MRNNLAAFRRNYEICSGGGDTRTPGSESFGAGEITGKYKQIVTAPDEIRLRAPRRLFRSTKAGIMDIKIGRNFREDVICLTC